MTVRRETPTPRPVIGAGRSASEEEPEEATEERTIEFDVDTLVEELRDAEAERDAADGAAVATEIEDKSAGAGTPRELAARRGRRNTLASPIPSMLARSMRPAPASPHVRPAASPVPEAAARAARGEGVPGAGVDTGVHAIPAERESRGYSIESGARPVDAHSAPTAEQAIPKLGAVGTLVYKARFCLDAGDIAEAVLAASAAVAANEQSPEPAVGDLNDTAGGPLARIFTAGPVSKVPVMNRSDAELETVALDELHWALLRRMNGRLTLDEVFRATKIPAIDALKIAAALLRDGIIRVQDRTRA